MVFIVDPQNSGIAGNMIAGAMVDLGINSKDMKEIMEFVTEDFGGVEVNIKKINKQGIESTYLEVISNEDNYNVNYDIFLKKIDNIPFEDNDLIMDLNNQEINHSEINHNNIKSNENNLKDSFITLSKNIFNEIAIVESKIHGKSIGNIHFHEVGAADAIADIFGSIFGYFKLGMNKDKVIGLPIATGGGTTNSSHGRIPIPAPATLELLKGMNCFGGPIASELATPTGVAIFKEICNEFNQFQPTSSPKKIAYGAGKKDFDFPNVLRIIEASSLLSTSQIDVIETNVDHINGETLGFLFDKLFEVGARDVTITPTLMKKGRPGHLIKVISKPIHTESILSIIFEETATLGIRVSPQTHRGIAKREIISLDVNINGKKYKIRFKVGTYDNKLISARPEYEDIKKIAIETKIPLMKVEKIASLNLNSYFININKIKNF